MINQTQNALRQRYSIFPNNDGDHRIRAVQRKSNGEDDWTKSREAIEVSCKKQNIGPITIRRDVGTTTSNNKTKSYTHAKRKQKTQIRCKY